MVSILSLRLDQLGHPVGGLQDASATAQTLSLLRREAPLSPADLDRLEAGVIAAIKKAGTLQSFLEAGGLGPLLDRTIRPGATQLLQQAVGACPPWMLPSKPPSTGHGVLIPRAVLLKACLLQMLVCAMYARTALPSLRSAGRKEAVAGLARLALGGQEHELVRTMALTALAILLTDCGPSLVTPLQQLMEEREFLKACCQYLRAVVAPREGSVMEAEFGFLLEATRSAFLGVERYWKFWDHRAQATADDARARQLAAHALATLQPLLSPAAQAVWRVFGQNSHTASAAAGLPPGASLEKAACQLLCQSSLCLSAYAQLILNVLLKRQPDWQACRAVLPPQPFLTDVVSTFCSIATTDPHLQRSFSEVLGPFTKLLWCSLAQEGGQLGQAISTALEEWKDEESEALASGEMRRTMGVEQPLEEGAAHQDGPEGLKACARCSREETKELRMRVCSACRSAWYCSQECQTAAWPGHKAACKKLMAQTKGAAGTSASAG